VRIRLCTLSRHLAAPTHQPIGATGDLATRYGWFAPRSHHFSGETGSRTGRPGQLSRRIDRFAGWPRDLFRKRGQLGDQSLHLDAIIASCAAARRLE
jgi:hypothetical protein